MSFFWQCAPKYAKQRVSLAHSNFSPCFICQLRWSSSSPWTRVGQWNPEQKLRNWWSRPIRTLTKHWPLSAEWPYVSASLRLGPNGQLLHIRGRNNTETKKEHQPNRIQIPWVIESRKSVAAAGSQQNPKSHYKRKCWRRWVQMGGCYWEELKARQKRTWHVAHKHISRQTWSYKRWQPQWQSATSPPKNGPMAVPTRPLSFNRQTPTPPTIPVV